MTLARPVPSYLTERLSTWRSSDLIKNKDLYAELAEHGQSPRTMIISCCDSRVDPNKVFTGGPGDFFVVRNVANLVPPCAPGHDHHGTSAAVEYAVTALKVSHIAVMGHSGCGGVAACHDMCSGHAPELESEGSFIGKWVDILRPGFEGMKDIDGDRAVRLRALEQAGTLMSIANLATYPFVKDALEAGTLTLHALWIDVGTGTVKQYDPETEAFGEI